MTVKGLETKVREDFKMKLKASETNRYVDNPLNKGEIHVLLML